VWTRLVALVLLPLVGVAGYGGKAAADGAAQAKKARAIATRVERASLLVELRLALGQETFASGGLSIGAVFGLTPAKMNTLMRTDLVALRTESRARVDALFAQVGDTGSLPASFRQLQAARTRFDAPGADPATLVGEIRPVQVALAEAGATALERAERLVLDSGASYDMRTALRVLQHTANASLAVGIELDSLAQLLLPSAPEMQASSLELIRVARALFADASNGMTFVDRASWPNEWERAQRATASVRTQRTAQRIATLSPTTLPPFDLNNAMAVFADGMRSFDLYTRSAVHAAATSRAVAHRIEHTATNHWRSTLALVVALIVSAFAMAAFVARSIALPLRALAGNARRVTDGDLSLAPTRRRRGPRELREVSSTFDELVDNLRLVEGQVAALAAGELDGDVVDEPVPGRLGMLVHESVARLQSSIQQRDALRQQLSYEAAHDVLTGLPNRASVLESLGHALARAQRDGRAVALLVVGLDAFQHVNDMHGHDAGDTLLRVTAERLVREVRSGDVVSRTGGDEFAVVVEGVDQPSEVWELAQRLVAVIAEPVTIGAVTTRISASIGIAIEQDGGTDGATLLHAGALAAASARHAGGGRAAAFDDAMYAELERHVRIEAELRQALIDDEFVVHFQPLLSPQGDLTGAEALVRWQHDGALVPPNDFIPVAEASDVIVGIGRYVLRRACEQLVEWQAAPGLAGMHVAVNLSRRHLASLTVVDDVRNALEATGADPAQLVVEITETVVIDDFAQAVEHLHALRQLGVRIAIDDYGTGYTSLTHLRRLPVDIIKIDRSLVVAASEPADAVVLELMIGTAHALGIEVVAEGVETAAQSELVTRLGCDVLQGFLFSRPVPADDFLRVTTLT
jgi:diguanylate cyclase (GGDEF)-like protein